jgi:hypothetical protein
VQNGLLKAEGGGEARVGVERVHVAREAVEQRLIVARLLFHRRVGGALGHGAALGRGAAVAAPAAGAAHEGADLVDGEQVAVLVVGAHLHHDHGAFALVVDGLHLRAVGEALLRGERAQHLRRLLAVQNAIEAVVEAGGLVAVHRHLHDDADAHRGGHGGEGVEAVGVHLVHEAELARVEGVAPRAHTEGVERHVTLAVLALHVGRHPPEGPVYVDELVAALRGARLDVRDDGLHRRVDRRGVHGLREVADARPRVAHVLDAHGAAEAPGVTLGALPPQLAHEAAAHLVEPAGVGERLVGEPRHEGRHELGLEGVEEGLGENGLGHARPRDGGDGVHEHVVLLALDGERVREADEAQLGHGVVGLAEVAVDARGRRGEHHAAELLLAQVRPRGGRHAVRAEHVHAVDEVPVVGAHLGVGDVAQDARVVDHDVDAPEGVERALHDLGAVFDGVVVGDGLAAGGANVFDHLVGRGARATAARVRAAEVVDDHLRAAAREQQRVRATQAVAGPRDDRDLPIEAELVRHSVSRNLVACGGDSHSTEWRFSEAGAMVGEAAKDATVRFAMREE